MSIVSVFVKFKIIHNTIIVQLLTFEWLQHYFNGFDISEKDGYSYINKLFQLYKHYIYQ